MTERLRTLVLDANDFGWKAVAADTAVLGLLGLGRYPRLPPSLRNLRVLRGLRDRYEALGYVADWREALEASPMLDVRVCNITNLVDYARCLLRSPSSTSSSSCT